MSEHRSAPRFNKILLSIVVAASIGSTLTQAAEGSCEQEQKRYKGKLFDSIAQIDYGLAPRVKEAMNNAGVKWIALFGRSKLDAGKPGGDDDVMKLAAELPGRVIPGVPKFYADASGYNSMIVSKVNGFLNPDSRRAFVGELLVVHGDKSHGSTTASGERTLDTASAAFVEMIKRADALHIPFMLHWEVYNWDRDFSSMEALYKTFPSLTFIWPHAGFGSAEQVRTVIETFPNVMVTLSKKEAEQDALSEDKSENIGAPLIDSCGVIKPEWYQLLVDHPDRFMFGTDAHKDFRWKKYEKVVRTWQRILAQLPKPAAKAIAFQNAKRVYLPSVAEVAEDDAE